MITNDDKYTQSQDEKQDESKSSTEVNINVCRTIEYKRSCLIIYAVVLIHNEYIHAGSSP